MKEAMVKPLTDQQLDRLLDFIGYGRLDADVWFLGMEEAGGGEANIHTRASFQKVEDCAHAHKRLGITKFHWGKRVIQPTWRGMCYIMLRLEDVEPTKSNIRQYQAEKLGRYEGNTLLTELMPIPKPKVSQWGYEELIPQFASCADYYARVKPMRVQYLGQVLKDYKPGVVIGYGKSFWSAYKELFAGIRFAPNGQFEVGFDGTTLVILTGHFTARTMNGRFDDIVSIIKDSEVLE